MSDTLDNTNIEIVDSSLNTYQKYINYIENTATNIHEDIESKVFDADTTKNNVSDFLQNLNISTVTQDDINILDASYEQFYQDLKESNNINNRLKKIVSKYEATEAQLSHAKKTNTYFMLLAWMIIFIFVGAALFISIIEDKKDMNIFSKILLVLFSLIVVFYIVRNLKVYIEKNIQ